MRAIALIDLDILNAWRIVPNKRLEIVAHQQSLPRRPAANQNHGDWHLIRTLGEIGIPVKRANLPNQRRRHQIDKRRECLLTFILDFVIAKTLDDFDKVLHISSGYQIIRDRQWMIQSVCLILND